VSYGFVPSTPYIDLGDPDALDFTSDMTISAWVFPLSWEPAVGAGGYRTVLKKNGCFAFRQEYGYWTNSTSAVTMLWWDGSNIAAKYTNGNPSTNKWLHMAVTVSGNVVSSIYFDGVSQSLNSKTVANARDLTQHAYIGNDNAGGECFDGQIAELATWNVALTDAEIQALYRRFPAPSIRPTALTSYFPLKTNAVSERNHIIGVPSAAFRSQREPPPVRRAAPRKRYKAAAAASFFPAFNRIPGYAVQRAASW
jgi:hypothetical protein